MTNTITNVTGSGDDVQRRLPPVGGRDRKSERQPPTTSVAAMIPRSFVGDGLADAVQ